MEDSLVESLQVLADFSLTLFFAFLIVFTFAMSLLALVTSFDRVNDDPVTVLFGLSKDILQAFQFVRLTLHV